MTLALQSEVLVILKAIQGTDHEPVNEFLFETSSDLRTGIGVLKTQVHHSEVKDFEQVIEVVLLLVHHWVL